MAHDLNERDGLVSSCCRLGIREGLHVPHLSCAHVFSQRHIHERLCTYTCEESLLSGMLVVTDMSWICKAHPKRLAVSSQLLDLQFHSDEDGGGA